VAGRPSKYKPEYALQAEKLCALGATDADLASFFEVSVQTVNTWKDVHPAFLASIKDAKAIADNRVERRLYERAMGYEHDEVDIRVIANEVVMTPIRKIYAPDTTAAIFWLKNRQSDKWRDLKAIELGNKDGDAFRVVVDSGDGKVL